MSTRSRARPSEPEARAEFDCFGDRVAVYAGDLDWRGESPGDAVERSRQTLLAMHRTLTRFDPDSELSRLNADPRPTVPAGTLLLSVVAAVAEAAEWSGGLVDATRLGDLERAGYAFTRRGLEPIPLREALQAAPARRPAQPSGREAWREISIDVQEGTVTRPPGVRIDPGGLAKGLAADFVVAGLEAHDTYATDAAGDLRFGGRLGALREVSVADPFSGEAVGRYQLRSGGVATSGIGRRSWWAPDGSPAHHLIDPARGVPAFTGIVQATAFAPTAFEAEVRAKAAVLAGPGNAAGFLPHGGLLVFDDGSRERIQGEMT